MSRLFVRGIPKYVTEDRLKEHFSEKGEITDVRIMRTKEGQSRQFGFVGFRNGDSAAQAMSYFNSTYLDTCRLSVGIAKARGDESIARPW